MELGQILTRDKSRPGVPMSTWTGVAFYPLDPRPEEVNIIDIARALSNAARYNGMCRFYSVAEHSVLVSRLVPPELALEGLLHDAGEAYTGDVTRPMKNCMSEDDGYFKIERLIWRRAIAPKFSLPETMHPDVMEADLRICKLEKLRLHPRAAPWDIPGQTPDMTIVPYLPDSAMHAFLHRFAELAGLVSYEDLAAECDRLRDDDRAALISEMNCSTCLHEKTVDRAECNACARAWNESGYEQYVNWEPK